MSDLNKLHGWLGKQRATSLELAQNVGQFPKTTMELRICAEAQAVAFHQVIEWLNNHGFANPENEAGLGQKVEPAGGPAFGHGQKPVLDPKTILELQPIFDVGRDDAKERDAWRRWAMMLCAALGVDTKGLKETGVREQYGEIRGLIDAKLRGETETG